MRTAIYKKESAGGVCRNSAKWTIISIQSQMGIYCLASKCLLILDLLNTSTLYLDEKFLTLKV